MQSSSLVIDPRTARWLPFWDGATALCLLFTALVTPYEVAALPPTGVVLFVVNRIMDCVFATDLVVQFFLAFPVDGGVNGTVGSRWVTNPKMIRDSYLRGWFALDFSTTAIGVFDILSYVQSTSGEDSTNLSRLKALRVLRILRLVKLLKLLRGLTLLRRWETRLSIDYAVLSVVQAWVGVILFTHWSACAWMVQVGFADDLRDTWLTNAAPYCIPTAELSADVLGADELARKVNQYSGGTPFDDATYSCASPFALYSASLYWAVMTITSIGYGDITATNENEFIAGA